MTNDLLIEIAPNGQNTRLTLRAAQAGIPAAGLPFDRQPLNFNGPVVDKLRRGDASPAEIQQVTAQISQWIFGNDIAQHMTTALNQQGNDLLRLVFSITDDQLRESFADAPLELCSLQGGGIPLALNARNASIFHLLPKVGAAPLSASARTWPLRVLIVRSNPDDLGGAIPPGAAVRDEIHQALDKKGLKRDLVQVHLLSSEQAPDIIGRPINKDFRSQINNTPYDILVYLGHGDVLPVYTGLPPVNVLQLESDDAKTHITFPSDQLAVLLHERPVPVVLIIGCLTAGSVPADQKEGVSALLPQWVRGVQGLAQALVNSQSGVEFAVGTRYMLDTADAMAFLKAFFDSLLITKPGNVEAAVHTARRDLYLGVPGSYSWSAPTIFRNLGSEPFFPFLASPPANVCPTADQQQNLRSIFWDGLAKLPWKIRSQPGTTQPMMNTLAQVEEQYKQHIRQTAPCLIMPTYVEAHSDEEVTFSVELYGTLDVEELRGNLIVGGSNVKVKQLQAAPQLAASGYTVLSATQDNQASFSIERAAPASELQTGPILMATVQLDSASQVVYPTTLNIIRTKPQQPVCTGSNAVIVPAP